MVVLYDPERSLLKVGEYRKYGKEPFAGRQNARSIDPVRIGLLPVWRTPR